jgi:hypothetical protein
MTRGAIGAAGLLVAAITAAGAGTAEAEVRRAARAVQAVPDLGLTISVAGDNDGSVVLAATAGDLTVHKRVFADGTYAVRIRRGATDDVVISATPGRTRVAAGGVVGDLRPDAGTSFEGQARRVRESLARSEAVQRFRRIAAALDDLNDASPEALGLRITGAVIAELAGDPSAAQRFSRAMLGRYGLKLRAVQTGSSCYDRYQTLVVGAAGQLSSCLGSFNPFNPTRHLCTFVWTLQVESAWFQFLACSSIPVK